MPLSLLLWEIIDENLESALTLEELCWAAAAW